LIIISAVVYLFSVICSVKLSQKHSTTKRLFSTIQLKSKLEIIYTLIKFTFFEFNSSDIMNYIGFKVHHALK